MRIHVVLLALALVHFAGTCQNDCDSANPQLSVTHSLSSPLPLNTFATITEALNFATQRNYCIAKIDLTQGSYNENLTLNRDTQIKGADLRGSVILGSILGTGVSLKLELLTIDGASGTAIEINFGELIANQINVVNTQSVAEQPESGRAIALIQSVGDITDLYLATNQGHALHAKGNFTSVKANRVTVNGNLLNPLIAQNEIKYAPAILIENFAHADFTDLTLQRTPLINVSLREKAKAYFENLTITAPNDLPNPIQMGSNWSAIGLYVDTEAVAELNGFVITESESAGILSDDQGFVTAKNGLLEANKWSYVYSGSYPNYPGYDFSKCIDTQSVTLLNNLNPPLNTGSLGVPTCPPCTPGNSCNCQEPPTAACKTVPRI